MDNTPIENTSGHGQAATVPAEIDRWNWGAFLLTWIWGIGNNTFIALLMFVPFANLVMPFILGIKGSAWAWRNKRWESVEAFKATQRKWARWGVIGVVLMLLVFIGMFTMLISLFKSSDAYQIGVRALNANPAVIQLLGQPISTGFPTGGIHSSGPDGDASLSFSVEGPKGEGTVYLRAIKTLGQWKIDEAVLEDSKTGERIDLVD